MNEEKSMITTPENEVALPGNFEFIDQVNKFLNLSGWTAQRLAKSCGVSSAMISQFLNGKYCGDIDKLKKKLESAMSLERDKLSSRRVNPDFIETSVWKAVSGIASYCRMTGEIGVCCADAGIGKTESVREFAAQKPETLLLEADPGYTATVLFRELHDRLGNGGTRNLHEMFEECVDRLKCSSRLLIIDEAEQLPYKCLELLRRLHDKSGIGILLTGMDKLLANLTGYRCQYPQLSSRVGVSIRLQPLTKDDVHVIIDRLIGGNGIWEVFYKESKGNTRRLFKMMKLCLHLSDKNNRQIDTKIVEMASKSLQLEGLYK